MERQKNDTFLIRVLKDCTLLELATILITSRPHACEAVKAGRRFEIVGFGNKEIQEFAEKSFTNVKTTKEFLQQLNEYPHVCSLCYIPMNLVMIVDIFQLNKKRLPSTLTELYQLFIVKTIHRQIKKESENKLLCSPVPVLTATEMMCRILKGIPKEAVNTVLVLSKLAYRGFFDYYKSREGNVSNPTIVFTVEDLMQCGIDVAADWDGYGSLKVTHTHQLPTDTITYNFTHLTIQEFLCAVYMSTFPDQEQQHLLSEHFNDYPNVFIFLTIIA